LHGRIRAVLPVPVRAFSVSPALGFVNRVITQMQQRIQAFGCFNPHIAAAPAVAARRSAARDKFFAPKSRYAVSAVSGFDSDFRSINKHL
jgi:hypothetical protein